MQHIVVWDPKNETPEGEIIDGPERAAYLERNGVELLPYTAELAAHNAVGGYYRRSWGKGVVFNEMIGARGCPMIMYVMPKFPVFRWCAYIMPLEGAKETRGIFRLTTGGQFGTLTGGLGGTHAPVEIAELPVDEYGGRVVRGRNPLHCTIEGYLGISIYASAIGARVMWSALSQAAE